MLKIAPVSAKPNSTNATIVRARGPGDQEGNRVWPKVSVESAPQYRFIALDEAMPTEKTINTRGAIPEVSNATPCTSPTPFGTATPTMAPRIMGSSEPKVQPQ